MHRMPAAVLVGVLLMTELGGCASAARSRLRSALKQDEPPEDFAFAVTVHPPVPPSQGAPPPSAGTRRIGPARFVMEADWVLRASTAPRVSEDTFPGETRQLTHDQVQRLWWELRDSGLLTGPSVSPPRQPVPGAAVVSYSVAGVRRTLEPVPADRPPASRIIDRLAELAWLR